MLDGLLKPTLKREGGSYHSRRGLSLMEQPAKRGLRQSFWWRYEIKYHISESKAEAIAQFIKPYLKLDRYSELQPSGSYPIVSLYLDSEDLQLCRESMIGKKNRFKLRIRSYTDALDYPYFSEIKMRVNAIIIKKRAQVMPGHVMALLSSLSLPPKSYKDDEPALRQFQFHMHSIGAKPVVRVRYLRQAYEDDSHREVRITFDRELCYNVTSQPELAFKDQGWQHHSLSLGGGVILEVKFTGHYPAWLGRMVRHFDLRQQSISKYATSIKQASSAGLLCLSRLRE